MKDMPDFLKDAVNVYRTKHYIVKQDLYLDRNSDGDELLYSNDTFYLRNKSVDKLYEMIFKGRKNIDGKRLPSTSYSRRYVK